MRAQLDVFRDSPQAKAREYRIAADTARFDPHWTEEQRAARERYYLAEAARIENGGMSAPITGHENARWQAGGKEF